MNEIDSYYLRTEVRTNLRPELTTSNYTENCIIGGGLAGVSTMLSLLERNQPSTLIESETLGFGASGRNGGFLSSGFSLGIRDISRKVGLETAKELFQLSRDGVELVLNRGRSLGIDDKNTPPGIVRNSWFPKSDDLKREVDYMNNTFQTSLRYWSREIVRESYLTDRYNDAIFDPEGYQIHSLNYLHKCAEESERRGGKIFENTPAYKIKRTSDGYKVFTSRGSIIAKNLILCLSASKNWLNYRVAQGVLPIETYILLTEPLGNKLQDAIRAPYAVSDTRRVENYYRPLPDTRLLWGGGIGIKQNPNNLKQKMLNDLLSIYPQLNGIKADIAWSGSMGYASHRMPQIGKLNENLWYNQGFGGHGLNTTALGGELIARSIFEADDTYKLFSPFNLAFTARPLGLLGVQMIYWLWKLRDKFAS
jgi:gamma-glutamylputrescine oxidase